MARYILERYLAIGKMIPHDRAVTTRKVRPTRHGRRGAYHHGQLREALLDAAQRTLERGGTAALALRAIARQAGVSHAAAYHHFVDREALLGAVAARGFRWLAVALGAGASRGGGTQEFLEMGVAYVDFAAEHPALFRLMFGAEVVRGRERDADLRAASDAAFAVLLEGARQLEPGAGEDVARRRAVAAWSIVHGLASLLLEDQLAVVGYSLPDHDRIAREVLGTAPPARGG
jgi:AcrR family transcriptional regulator